MRHYIRKFVFWVMGFDRNLAAEVDNLIDRVKKIEEMFQL